MSTGAFPPTDPHAGQPVLIAGAPLASARAAMVLVHGRGASAGDILGLAAELDRGGFAYRAPQAASQTWYPHSFLAPLEANEPWLSSALDALERVLADLAAAGIPLRRTILLGFSQGACLALELAARRPRRFGGLVGLSGGVIGPPGTPREAAGDLDGSPVFLGCSDRDPHVPAERVLESAALLREMGGDVTERLYPGLGHAVNADELRRVAGMMDAVASAPPGGG